MKCPICNNEFGNGAECQNCGIDRVTAFARYDGYSRPSKKNVRQEAGEGKVDKHKEKTAPIKLEPGDTMTQSTMGVCPYCGEIFEKGAKYCPECGKKLFQQCPKCQNVYSSKSKYCPECGTQRETYLKRMEEKRKNEEEAEKRRLEREIERQERERKRQTEEKRQAEEKRRQAEKEGKDVCRYCGQIIPMDSKVCPVCGKTLLHQCPKCSKWFSSQFNICPECKTERFKYLMDKYLMDKKMKESEDEKARNKSDNVREKNEPIWAERDRRYKREIERIKEVEGREASWEEKNKLIVEIEEEVRNGISEEAARKQRENVRNRAERDKRYRKEIARIKEVERREVGWDERNRILAEIEEEVRNGISEEEARIRRENLSAGRKKREELKAKEACSGQEKGTDYNRKWEEWEKTHKKWEFSQDNKSIEEKKKEEQRLEEEKKKKDTAILVVIFIVIVICIIIGR